MPTIRKNGKKKAFGVRPGQASRQGERRNRMLQEFKNFNTESSDLEDLVAMAAFGRSYRAEFELQNINVPEFVDDTLRAVKREIEARMADRRATRIRELKTQRDSLKTAQERRDAIDRELAQLGETVGV